MAVQPQLDPDYFMMRFEDGVRKNELNLSLDAKPVVKDFIHQGVARAQQSPNSPTDIVAKIESAVDEVVESTRVVCADNRTKDISRSIWSKISEVICPLWPFC